MNAEFSVLLSVYGKENADFFRTALQSVAEQTCPPTEIVVMEDGPLTDELYQVLDSFRPEGIAVRRYAFRKNQGLAKALNVGLTKCRYAMVARMDSDDIAVPDRFERQLAYMNAHPDIAAVGGQIEEFAENPDEPQARRQVPTEPSEVRRRVRLRNPMNHMTVMYRKEAVLAVQGYPSVANVEDYLLWGKLLSAGYELANLPEVLVKARVGNGMVGRRIGKAYFRNEMKVQRMLLARGLSDPLAYMTYYGTRKVARMLPKEVLDQVYMRVIHGK